MSDLTPLDQFTTDEIADLEECVGSGNVIVLWIQANAPLKTMPVSRSPYRNKAVLFARTRIIGQDMTACGVATTQTHTSAEDVFRVRETVEKRTRKWYRKPAEGPGDWTLYTTLEWVITTSVSPTAVAPLRLAGGGAVSPPTCVPVEEGDKPEHWDDGYHEDGFLFTFEAGPTTFEDRSILTGAEAAEAGKGLAVTLSDIDWRVVKTFGRAWASGNTPTFADFTTTCLSTSVRRVVVDLELGGWRLASTLKWTETQSKPGESSVVTERAVEIDAGNGWAYTLDSGYPTYGWTTTISNLRIVSV